MAVQDLLHQMSSVTFEMKMKFSASQDLSSTRSKILKLPTESQLCVFSIKPPDFSVKLYNHLTVSQKKDKKTLSDAGVGQLHKIKQRSAIFSPNIINLSPKKTDARRFNTSHKPLDGLQSQLMFVRMGKFPSDPYRNPKPHNFRPLDEDLPDIKTAHQRDPGNLNFKLKHLDTLQTSRSELNASFRDMKTQLDTYKPAEPKWDSKLCLPHLPWPPKSASFTRHRRRRGAYSAFLDRVEKKLGESWKNKNEVLPFKGHF